MVPPAALCLKEFQGRDREDPFQSLREIWPELQRAGGLRSIPSRLPPLPCAARKHLRFALQASSGARGARQRSHRLALLCPSCLFRSLPFLAALPYFLPPKRSAHM